ncbi:hypothetical protein L6164_008574 [Bauhinia variegata]|uniref:Uncharacterized protein n=1 Tax=Bauhinia variegata TaxID=167791 RepID=A0ACB9PIA5_BAUVA|nr:hypothetical protein L6164_008574 [Bauhinia variegata]
MAFFDLKTLNSSVRGLSSLPPNPNSITSFKQPPRRYTSTALPVVSSSTQTPNPTSYLLMANDNHHVTIPNANEPTKPLVACANELATLNKPLDHEDLIEKIHDGLDDDYQPIVDAINGRDTPISFDELHEKLINKELSLWPLSTAAFPHPTSANPTNTRFSNRATYPQWSWSPHRHSTPHQSAINYPPINRARSQPRPYLGWCQGCRQQGHTILQCSLFRVLPSTPLSTPGLRPPQHGNLVHRHICNPGLILLQRLCLRLLPGSLILVPRTMSPPI